MTKIKTGLIFGALAGVIDVTPMIIQGLTWDANTSAFCFWLVAGFMVATSSLRLPSVFKGILISFLVLSPTAVLIAWQAPVSLIPISIMTLILGSLLGHLIDRIGRN